MSEEVVSLAPIADELALDGELDEATAYFLSQLELWVHVESYMDNPSRERGDHLLARIKNEHAYDILKLYSEHYGGIPFDACELLAENENELVLNAARSENTPIKSLECLSQDEDFEVRRLVIQNPNTPPEVLTRLVWDEDEQVRCEVARSKRTPIEALEYLAEDREVGVLYAVAENPNTPPELLARLAKDEYEEVRSAAIKNLNT
jgi:hypothetical protein